MTPEGVVAVVTRLYAASGRRVGEVEHEVWGEALGDLDDELAVAAARTLVREVDLSSSPPSPHQLIQLYRRLAARRPALPPAPEVYVSPEDALANIARLKELIRTEGPKRCPT